MPGVHEIVVVGGGPKAVAIAVHAHIRRSVAQGDVRVTVVEPHEIGANWTGRYGLTDGDQELCSPPEHDLVYPESPYWTPATDDQRLERSLTDCFSWQAYQRHRKKPAGSPTGTTHKEFGRYLSWAFDQTGANFIKGTVTGLSHKAGRWAVAYSGPHGMSEISCDGVVITGNGTAMRLPMQGNLTDYVFDAADYWQRRESLLEIASLPTDDPYVIVVVGAGGAAATIAADLWQKLTAQESAFAILVITPRATLFSRGESRFEHARAVDEEAWSGIPLALRKDFVDRYSIGVVSGRVMEALDAAVDSVAIEVGRVFQVNRSSQSPVPERQVITLSGRKCVRTHGCRDACKERSRCLDLSVPADAVVDARGFDSWWFRNLLPKDLALQIAQDPAGIQEALSTFLELELPGFPRRLHVPNLAAQRYGVGVASLLALGSMAKRVLRAYR